MCMSVICTELGSFNRCFSTVCNWDKYICDVLSKGKKEQVHVYCTFSHFVIDTIKDVHANCF